MVIKTEKPQNIFPLASSGFFPQASPSVIFEKKVKYQLSGVGRHILEIFVNIFKFLLEK